MRSTWKLGEQQKERVGVAHFGSGQDDRYYVRVRWSEKLGLQLKQVFGCREKAQAVAEAVKEATKLTMKLWQKEYYPGSGWEHCQYVD